MIYLHQKNSLEPSLYLHQICHLRKNNFPLCIAWSDFEHFRNKVLCVSLAFLNTFKCFKLYFFFNNNFLMEISQYYVSSGLPSPRFVCLGPAFLGILEYSLVKHVVDLSSRKAWLKLFGRNIFRYSVVGSTFDEHTLCGTSIAEAYLDAPIAPLQLSVILFNFRVIFFR